MRRTRAALERALIGLVEERELSQISVADRAEVSRSTFYDHYRDVHELAVAACTSMIDELIGVVLALDPAHPTPSGAPVDPDPSPTAFLAHFADHAGLYRSLLGHSSPAHSSAWPPTWLRCGCPSTPAEVTTRTKPLLQALTADSGRPPTP